MKNKLPKIILILGIVSIVIILVNNNIKNNTRNNNSNETLENKENLDGETNMKIKTNGQTLKVNLENNDTTASLLKILPLEISMSELNGNEKYYYLDTSLPTDSKSIGTIHAGDIMLYGDNCLVIFYETFNTSYSYTKIGHIDYNNLKNLLGSGNINVIIYN